MILKDVIDQAEQMSGERYKLTVWLSWLNMAQAELERLSRVQKTVVLPLVVGTNEYDIPSSLREVNRLSVESGKVHLILPELSPGDFDGKGYRLEGGKITLQNIDFQAGDTLKVVGFKKLMRFTEQSLEEEIPDIPESFQQLYVHYLVFRANQKEGWQPERDFSYGEWITGKEQFEREQYSQNLPRRIRARRWC